MSSELAAAAAEGDELRRLPERTWKTLLEAGFLRALQPARWGGGETTFVEFLDAVVEVSRASASAGWVAGVVGVHPWQLALFPEEAQAEMWSDDPARMHSSSYNPTGKARKVDGGYLVSGRWSFSSGCDYCRGVNLGAIAGQLDLGGGLEVPEFRSFLLQPDQYRIEDNWRVAGLQGTGSKDIVVEETFVPGYRTQSHVDYALGAALPGQDVNPGPLYRLPWSVVFNLALAASTLGAARGFLDTWTEESRPRVFTGGGRLADDALTQRRLAEATWSFDVAVTQLRADAGEMWEMAEARHTPSMPQRARWRWHATRGCELIGAAVADLFHVASGRSIFLDHPLQRRFQDVQAALGHAFLASDPLARAVGGELLGTAHPELVL